MFNGRRQCRVSKTPGTRCEGGGFKVELENVTKLRRGRPLGPSMAWEEGGVAAMVRRRTTGMVAVAPALLGWRWKKPAGPVGPKRLSGLVRPAGRKQEVNRKKDFWI
jgi:hypothetical protein